MPGSPTKLVNGITKINPINFEKNVAADKINVPRSNRDKLFQLLLKITKDNLPDITVSGQA
jgi:hypothetical protein